MATASDDLYGVFLADLTEPERERVRQYAEQFGIEPTDAVWALMIVLGRYSDIYSTIPAKIEVTVRGLLEKIRDAAGDSDAVRERLERSVKESLAEILRGQAEHMAALYDEVPARIDETVKCVFDKVERAAKVDALASRNRLLRSVWRVLLNGLLRPEGRREIFKGFVVTFLMVAVVVGFVGGLAYWAGFDHGRVRGYSAGTEGRVIESWALSPEGVSAYRLWHSGELSHLVACDRPGWRIEDDVCVPRASGLTVYGWKLR